MNFQISKCEQVTFIHYYTVQLQNASQNITRPNS